jgi:hypothetical protein
METELKRPIADSARRAGSSATNERRELALLAEFMRHESVASLANDIAERLGANGRGEDLIAAAGLGVDRRDGSCGGGSRKARPQA